MKSDESENSAPRRTGLIAASVAVGILGLAGAVAFLLLGGGEEAGAASTVAEPELEPMPEFDTLVERGEWLYANRGCVACHGEAGQGGVVNANYVLDTVPALDEMAERLMLFEPEDARAATELLEEGADLEALSGDPPFPGYARFLAQYRVVMGVIENGATAAKKDPAGETPPLQMPPWGAILSPEDRRAIIAYLISLYDWEAAEEEEEGQWDDEGWEDEGSEDESEEGGEL